MNIELFNKIKNSHYPDFVSFAVWNDNDVCDVSAIYDNIDCLNKDIVIVGLNTNGNVEKFRNFHYKGRGGRDIWLRESLNRSCFRGSYMTDIIKNDTSSRSTKVNLSDQNIKTNIELFKEELKFIESKKPFIIAIGSDSYEILRSFCDDVYYVPHYAKRGITKQQFIESFSELEKKFL